MLPRLLVLTDRTLTRGRPVIDVVHAAVEGGADCVVVREKDLPRGDRADLVRELRAFVPRVLVASDMSIRGDGVHLAAREPFPDRACAAGDANVGLVGRSCHSRNDLEAAAAEGCDYATLSPIFLTPSKPGYGPPLGVDALRDVPLPVYALGGVDVSTARRCIDRGATGVAVMGAVMGADDPAALVKELLS